SSDNTLNILEQLCAEDRHYSAISLSRNRGHQNALLAGLMTAKDLCDVTVSIDCDGQDDINAIDEMLKEYESGVNIVYGVRSSRKSDTFFKRTTAMGFYKLMNGLGAESVYNHADFRLMDKKALEGLAEFEEVNLFLRGLAPLVGYRSSIVYYERTERLAGKSHYPFKKMLSFALDGITSLSVKPIKLISALGLIVFIISLIMLLWSLIMYFIGHTVAGWSSIVCIVLFLGGVQLLSIGVIGEYIGKIYSEVKKRPRYIIDKKINLGSKEK
ncbi:MAG: glycosyltransferase family 2 protein, partial [Clostridia bacterium]|nr:glycosyltransferase family 2 protein [Clostridia bacterium]